MKKLFVLFLTQVSVMVLFGQELTQVKIPFKNDSRKTEFEYYVRGNNSDGMREGSYTWFHENGKIKAKGFYRNNLLDGVFINYYNDGSIRTEMNFVNGKLDGKHISYYFGGGKEEEGYYKNGLKDGIWKYFGHNGTEQTEFIQGKTKEQFELEQ